MEQVQVVSNSKLEAAEAKVRIAEATLEEAAAQTPNVNTTELERAEANVTVAKAQYALDVAKVQVMEAKEEIAQERVSVAEASEEHAEKEQGAQSRITEAQEALNCAKESLAEASLQTAKASLTMVISKLHLLDSMRTVTTLKKCGTKRTVGSMEFEEDEMAIKRNEILLEKYELLKSIALMEKSELATEYQSFIDDCQNLISLYRENLRWKRARGEVLASPATQIHHCTVPDQSASSTAKLFPAAYDMFLDLSDSRSFQPNNRIKHLQKRLEEAPANDDRLLAIELRFRAMPGICTFGFEASDTCITSDACKRFVNAIKWYITTIGAVRNPTTEEACLSRTYLGKQTIKSEHVVRHDTCVVIGAAVAGIRASKHVAQVKLLQACGNAALSLYGKGLNVEDCVVPGVMCSGDFIHIYAVYLLEGGYPILTSITDPVYYCGDFSTRMLLAHYVSWLAIFAIQTAKLIDACIIERRVTCAALNTSTYFFKPIYPACSAYDRVSRSRSILCDILMCYRRIEEVAEAEKYVLFPRGVMTMASREDAILSQEPRNAIIEKMKNSFFDVSGLYPVIVYPQLNMYDNEKPPECLREQYRASLKAAVDVLNSAMIAHFDLLPTNVMWRCDEYGMLKMQIIDFDTATPFGELFFIDECYYNDSRYPFFIEHQKRHCKASRVHNAWFIEAISRWLDDEENHFTWFMNKHGKKLRDYMASEICSCIV